MNKRIEKLIEQATQHSPEGFYTYTQIDAEKFAELIVRECIDIANEQFSAQTGLDDRDCWTVSEIKERFGVK